MKAIITMHASQGNYTTLNHGRVQLAILMILTVYISSSGQANSFLDEHLVGAFTALRIPTE